VSERKAINPNTKAWLTLLIVSLLFSAMSWYAYSTVFDTKTVPSSGVIANAEISVSPGSIDWGRLEYGTSQNMTVTLNVTNTGFADLLINIGSTALPTGMSLDLPADFALNAGTSVLKDVTLRYFGAGTPGDFAFNIVVNATG
jgi:hypothetical protein